MISLQDNLYRPSFNYIKKERFTGSNEGTRFLFEKKQEEDRIALVACVWPEPFSFEHTDEERKEYKDFTFSEEGLQEAMAWVNEKVLENIQE